MTISQYNIYPILTPVRLVSTTNISGSYFNGSINNGVGGTITTASSTLTIDAVLVNNNDPVLLIGQTNANENGIYIVNAEINPVVLTRRQDFQNIEQLKSGQTIAVSSGNTQAGGVYTLIDPLPGHFGVDPLSFTTAAGSGTGTAADKDASDNSQPTVSSVVGPTVANGVAVFADTSGSVTAATAGTVTLTSILQVGEVTGLSGFVNLIDTTQGTLSLTTVTNLHGNFTDTLVNNQNNPNNVNYELPFTTPGQAFNSIVGNNGPTTFNTNAFLKLGKANGTEAGGSVTTSGQSGVITTSALTTAAGSAYVITWTNTFIETASSVLLTLAGGTNTIKNLELEVIPLSGSATLNIWNINPASALNGTIIINYLIV